MFELTRGLVSRLLVCNARRRASKGNNSDKPDALRLAQVLRAGLLKAAYHGSPSTQTLKQLVHCYDSLTEDTTRVMDRIKARLRSLKSNLCLTILGYCNKATYLSSFMCHLRAYR